MCVGLVSVHVLQINELQIFCGTRAIKQICENDIKKGNRKRIPKKK